MTSATLNGVVYGEFIPAAIFAGWMEDARIGISQRAREMQVLTAFARSARLVGPAHDGTNGDIETATQLISRRNFGEIPKHNMANKLMERGLSIRILTGFTLVILLTLFIAGWSYYHISTLGTAAEHLFIENYRSIGYMHSMELALANIEEDAPFATNDAIIRQNLALEYKNITEPGELNATQALDRDYAEYVSAPSNALAGRVRNDCEAILDMNQRAMYARSEAIKAQADFARNSTIAVTLLLVGVAVFLAIAVSRRSLAEFQELDRAKSNFVATAAHELKNPLAAIKTTSALLKDGIGGPLTEKQREMAASIHTESNRVLNLVRELLDLAKLEAGTLELHSTPVDVETLLESAVLPVALRAEEHGVAVDLAVGQDVPEVTVDPNKMAWAVTNLLSNAIRYSKRGTAVEVKASVIEGATTAAQREVWISVTDHGKGIAEKDLGRIFDKFVQIEDSAMGTGSGTGLGLAIAREIVIAHGGRIWATSTVGQGSTFTIALPLHRSRDLQVTANKHTVT